MKPGRNFILHIVEDTKYKQCLSITWPQSHMIVVQASQKEARGRKEINRIACLYAFSGLFSSCVPVLRAICVVV